MALGIGSDYYNLKNMDVIVCSRENNNVDISHYFLEDKNSQPFEHRSRIRLIDFGIDNESGISWCTFVRPQRPVSISKNTMLQILSKCEVRAAWRGYFTIYQPVATQMLREIKLW